ncbi:unnamed protein product [Rotaria sp. Silwood1]|nr:unnamed protein product [Rotaria sp. Silwood1]
MNYYYYNKTNQCQLQPTDWTPQFDLTGRYQLGWGNFFMDISQTGYDVQWTYETTDDRYTFVGQYINETMISGMQTNIKKRTNCVVLQNFELSVVGKRNFCRIRATFTCYCIDELPGINDISSGYDAAKMLSASEQNSKYRIFDLSEESTTTFRTKVLGQDRIFTRPKLVQITEINVRKQDTYHQAYYNQFIETYGTHYISRIIVGGTAHLYTLLDSSYHKVSSYEETSSQVSLMFQYKGSYGQYGSDTNQIWASMKETFKKTSATFSIFQPPVASQNNKSDWETWQQTAGNYPVVVNRTLFSIHNLIKNKPPIREHFRKTIEFYLQKGVMPTLAELNGQITSRSSLILSKPQNSIMGLDIVGCGYDPLLMESKYCLFDQNNFTDNEQWSDPYNKTLTYSIPNGWFVVNTPESLTFDGSILITSIEDYFRSIRTVNVRKSGNWLGIDRRHSQKLVTEFYRRFYQDNYNLVLRMKQIGWYTLSVTAFPYPKLNPTAQIAFNNLPTYFDIKDLKIWKNFFNIFGTHIVVSSNMGGQVWAETWYETCLTYEYPQTWIDEQVNKN